MPSILACTVCGWKYNPADHPADAQPEKHTPPHDHQFSGGQCVGADLSPLVVSPEPAPRPMPSRSIYTRESLHPPELGGEAG